MEKGNSIIAFPKSYVVLDLETTGLSHEINDIIEIGAVKYFEGKEIETFQSLVRPPIRSSDLRYVSQFITGLTGITNKMLETAPDTETVLEQFSEFLGDNLIVGYNVGFDVGFLCAAYERYLYKPLLNDYIDILRMAKKLYPEMNHHRLCDMVEKFSITTDRAHRALEDAFATAVCLDRFHDEAVWQFGSEEVFCKGFKCKKR